MIMDVLGIMWIPDIVVYILVLAVALYIYGVYPFMTLASYGYDGPKPKPFMGNIDLAFKTGHVGSWYLTGKRLYGKIFAMYEGRNPVLVVFDLDIIKQIMVKEFSSFGDRTDTSFRGPIIRHSLVDLKGADWRRVRALSSPFFSTMKLRQNVPLLGHCVRNLTSRCEKFSDSKAEFDVKEICGAFTLETICLTAFGLQVDSQNDPDHIVLRTVRKIMSVGMGYWGFAVAFAFPKLVPFFEYMGCEVWPKGSIDVLARVTKEAIEERRKSKEDRADFVQAMIKAHEVELELEAAGATADEARRWKALTEDEICAQAALFILAGYETTATALSFLLFNLADNPQCQERLLDEINDAIGENEVTYDKLKEMTYLDMCLEESLRLHPSVFRVTRKCTRDITINGYFFPKDTYVVIPLYGLQHDPEYWKDPDTYNPERFSQENRADIHQYAYQAFGSGPRKCVGMKLAQIEIKMAVINIVKNYHVKVGPKTKLPLTLAPTLLAEADGGLWLQVDKRH